MSLRVALVVVLVSRFVAARPQRPASATPRSQIREGHCVCKIRVRGACSAFPIIADIGWFDDSAKGGPKLSCCEKTVCQQRALGWASDCDAPVESSFISVMGGNLSSPLTINDAVLRRLRLHESKPSLEKQALQNFTSRCGADIVCAKALAILIVESAKVYMPTAFPALLEFGGFTCYAFIKLLTGNKLVRGVSDDANIRALRHLCGDSEKRPIASPASVVVLQHHNGLGNQLFQNLFGELLARDIGYMLARTTDTLVPACGKETKDPHTDLGFHAFRQLRAENDSFVPVVPDYHDLCSRHHIWISYGMKHVEKTILTDANSKDCEGSLCNARTRPEILHVLARNLIEYMTSDNIAGPRCVLLVGYFQDLAMYGNANAVQDVLSEFTFSHPNHPSKRPAAAGVDRAALRHESAAQKTVVHFRHEPKEMVPFKRFYREHLESLNGPIEILTANERLKNQSTLIAFLKDTFGARLYPSSQAHAEYLDNYNGLNVNPEAVKSLIDDFQVMVFADNFVPFPHSTLSFWACVFSLSQRVHDDEDEHRTATLPPPFLSLCSLRSQI